MNTQNNTDTLTPHAGKPATPAPIEGFIDFGHLSFDHLHNTRDLGGLRTTSGKQLKMNRLIRSGDLHAATEADIAKLTKELNVERVIDFRTDAERNHLPDPTNKMSSVMFYDLPVIQMTTLGITHENTLSQDIEFLEKYQKDPFALIGGVYPTALLGSEGKRAYGNFLDILLNAETGATLWHCTEGKDRAGLGSVLVEYALGVSKDDIYKDYLATNLFVRNHLDHFADAIEVHHLAKHLDADIDALYYAYTSYLDGAFEAVEQAYGSMDTYLTEALHFGEGKREKLQELYLI
ncbi:tyrosine-protein phosphatase [Eggerthellaceae bacterium 3-80]|nr:tyrosine-protein phosphatase [bacterium D16-34]